MSNESTNDYNTAHPPFQFRFASAKLHNQAKRIAKRNHLTLAGFVNRSIEDAVMADVLVKARNRNASARSVELDFTKLAEVK